ncbi:endonuclease domain-containing protein [Defluviicoccus vanus]|uniref:Endonuclease domain-containing protein n=1 Tax=Defluviicoccus vanus TaxID=111831 RepID=A0A7H1N1G4_9PROT|nr:endonuclease domain-containing protein [Defluviicoccus vanus]QNT69550.1 endonuclease domain-containing protein [Defluviicoccus vanus]
MIQEASIQQARQLRRDATPAERTLWRHLRNGQLAGLKFRRQVPIGPYIVDFVCVETKVVVEVDGGQHADNAADRLRDGALRSKGYRVVRVWNSEVMESIEGVLANIAGACGCGE